MMRIELKRLSEIKQGDYLLFKTYPYDLAQVHKVLSVICNELCDCSKYKFKYSISFLDTSEIIEYYEYASPDEQYLIPVIINDKLPLPPLKPALPEDRENQKKQFLKELAMNIIFAGGCLMYPEELEKMSFSEILHMCFNNRIKLSSSYERKNG